MVDSLLSLRKDRFGHRYSRGPGRISRALASAGADVAMTSVTKRRSNRSLGKSRCWGFVLSQSTWTSATKPASETLSLRSNRTLDE